MAEATTEPTETATPTQEPAPTETTEPTDEVEPEPVEDVLVPAVVRASPRVLVMEWLDGSPLTEVARDGTQAQRDQVHVAGSFTIAKEGSFYTVGAGHLG